VTKKFKTGDGMFFQWTLASGIFMMGIFMYLFQCSQGGTSGSGTGCPAFQPFSMLGGALWATGNIMTVPIIKTLGLSMGMLTWGMANMVVGWASARFGILGVPQESFSSPTLNTVGVVVAIASMVVFAFIKPTVEKVGAKRGGGGGGGDDAKDSLLGDGDVDQVYAGLYGQGINSDDAARPAEGEDDEKDWTDALSAQQKKIFGFVASVVAGLFYGVNFNPPTYVANKSCLKYPPPQPAPADCFVNAPTSTKDHIFFHFTGIWLAATLYFCVYAVATKNKPRIYADATFPGMVSGMIWATAQISWFFANADLGQATAFPIISCVQSPNTHAHTRGSSPPSPPPSLPQHWPGPCVHAVGHFRVWRAQGHEELHARYRRLCADCHRCYPHRAFQLKRWFEGAFTQQQKQKRCSI
jgi:hypothetical protein